MFINAPLVVDNSEIGLQPTCSYKPTHDPLRTFVLRLYSLTYLIIHRPLFCVCRSLGCTVVEMLSGKPLWHHFEGIQIIYRIGSGCPPEYTLPADVTEVSRQFIDRCFIHNPSERPSATELLHHPFVMS